MPLAITPQGFVPVIVTADWSTAENAETDCETSLTAVLGITLPMLDTLILAIVEGSADPDDKASLQILANGTASWSNSFTTVPAIGQTVYIIDAY